MKCDQSELSAICILIFFFCSHEPKISIKKSMMSTFSLVTEKNSLLCMNIFKHMKKDRSSCTLWGLKGHFKENSLKHTT